MCVCLCLYMYVCIVGSWEDEGLYYYLFFST